MHAPSIVTVILNTNRRRDLLECLRSLRNAGYGNRGTIVLDNRSSDGSIDAVRGEFPEAGIIELKDNLGYAGNNNVGIEAALKAGADWVFLLNEDTVVDPACLARLVEVGESGAQIGMLGPMVYHHDEPGVIQSAGGLLGRAWKAWHIGQNEVDRGQFSRPREVDWISGCAILVRRPVIAQAGALDGRFFYYWEETEWCLRARKLGWRIVHVPDAKIWHKGVRRDYRPTPAVTYYSTRNRLLMMSKHGAPPAAWVLAWGEMARTLISWTVRPKWKSMRAHRDVMCRGIVDFLRGRWGPMQA